MAAKRVVSYTAVFSVVTQRSSLVGRSVVWRHYKPLCSRLQNELKDKVARRTTHVQTCLATKSGCCNSSCVNTDFWQEPIASDWIKLRRSDVINRSYVTSCRTSLPWTTITRNTNRFCCKRQTCYFLQHVFATCNNLSVVRQVRFVGGKTPNIAYQLDSFCSSVAKQVAGFCFPFYLP